ncbi:MAG: isochorismatase family protein, partial [Deltaproteobacteria bacterium]|nr:isochorismatase family protein [Deltaproteobacteria bacterium]
LPNTEGINFHQNVTPLPNETIIKKHYPNSFRETDLSSTLESMKIQEITVCGMMSHMCIDATVRAAFDAGYRCIVAHDACATRNLTFNGVDVSAEYVQAGIMAALGSVYAQVLTGEVLINMLAG